MFRHEAEKLCASAQCAARVSDMRLAIARELAGFFVFGRVVSTPGGSEVDQAFNSLLIPSLSLRVLTRHSSDRTATLRNEFEGVILKKI